MRRSPRHTPDAREEEDESEEDTTTTSPGSDSGPCDTATAHGHLRPQLSRAPKVPGTNRLPARGSSAVWVVLSLKLLSKKRALKAQYGSHTRKGIIFGLQVLVTFVQCPGEQFEHTSQDPAFYLRTGTAGMKASGKWKNVPSRCAYDQRQKTVTATLTLNAGNHATLQLR